MSDFVATFGAIPQFTSYNVASYLVLGGHSFVPLTHRNFNFLKDEEQRQKLNRITHPEIYKEMWWEAVKCAASGQCCQR